MASFFAQDRFGSRRISRNRVATNLSNTARVSALLISARLVLASIGAVAATFSPSYRVDVWRTDDGLPQSSVTSIIQTREGYLWLGTFGGAARFDGVRFKTFGAGSAPLGFSRRILSLFEDQRGAIWAGTEEGDLLQLDGEALRSFSPPNQGGTSKYIRSFAETSDGLWMNTAEGRLIRFAGDQFTEITTNWILESTSVNSLGLDAAGRLWIGTEKELAQWKSNTFEVVWNQKQEPDFDAEMLASSRKGGIWVAGQGRLRRFDQGRWVSDYGAFPWTKGVLMCLLEDRQGQLWAGTYGGGLFCYSTNGSVTIFSRAEGLPSNVIRSLLEDKEGNLWAGTEGRGLARLKPAIFTSLGRGQGLASDLILTVSEGQEGELWIGTNGDGLDRLKDGKIRHFGPKEGLTNECVWSVLEDSRRNLWVGTWGGGLFKLENDTLSPFGNLPACGPVVCGLFEDSQQRLWLGQLLNEATITHLFHDQTVVTKLPVHLPRVDARAIVEDKTGRIWLGTRGDGLYSFHQGQCTRFTRENGLVSEFILALYADPDGIVWIGTRDGLNRMQDSRLTTFTVENGLVDNTICSILEDNEGHLWFGSGSGVFQADKQELNRCAAGKQSGVSCFGYTKADGLPSLECSSGCQPAACKTRDGRLWFPTVNGLAVVDPKQVIINPIPPPVRIEEVVIEENARTTLFEVPSPRTAAGVAIDSAAPEPALLKVAPGKPRFEFHYTGLSFSAPEKVRFRYKLEPLEETWVEAGTRRSALYSYLQPGNYRFRVLACNNDGIWNQVGASLSLVLLPHYWQTWWFRCLVAGLIILFFVGIYEIRLAAERRLNRLRWRIARDLHDEVGSNLGSIALLGEVAPKTTNVPYEEISEIRRIALQTIESLRDIVWFLDPGKDNLEDLVPRMRETARTMLPGIKFDLRSSIAGATTCPSLELRRNLFPIFKEILHNIVRHSRATQVEIEVETSPRQFLLKVSDNGKGFEESTVRPGNGLKNLRRRAADLKGELKIASNPGQGTTVTLKAPVT